MANLPLKAVDGAAEAVEVWKATPEEAEISRAAQDMVTVPVPVTLETPPNLLEEALLAEELAQKILEAVEFQEALEAVAPV